VWRTQFAFLDEVLPSHRLLVVDAVIRAESLKIHQAADVRLTTGDCGTIRVVYLSVVLRRFVHWDGRIGQ